MKRVSQTEKIRQLLIENTGVPVPAFKLAAISLQYNARVFELRAEGFEIINTTHHRADGSVWSWFEHPAQKGQLALPCMQEEARG